MCGTEIACAGVLAVAALVTLSSVAVSKQGITRSRSITLLIPPLHAASRTRRVLRRACAISIRCIAQSAAGSRMCVCV
eukprot:2290504-Rhodomonas_salina.1